MDEITIDGMGEMDFRRLIEEMLRRGEADEAATKLRDLLRPFAGEGGILPARFMTVAADQISFRGWDELTERIGQYDRPELKISALSIALADPEDAGAEPGEDGRMAPCIETCYFSDSAFPFSVAARDDLLDGYSHYGCEWQGDFEKSDSTLSVEGIDDLYGAIVRLEAKLLDSEQPDPKEISAGSLGACYLAVLIHQALRDTVRKKGLPRALCVMAGRDEVYPFFDAPVMTSEEYRHDGQVEPVADGPKMYPIDDEESDVQEPDEQEVEADGLGYNSLLSIGVRSPKKKPVIALDPEEAQAATQLEQLAASEELANRDKPARVDIFAGLNSTDPGDGAAAFATPQEEFKESPEPDTFADATSFREPPEQDLQDWGGKAPVPNNPPIDEETDQGWPTDHPEETPDQDWQAGHVNEVPDDDWQTDQAGEMPEGDREADHADEPEHAPEPAAFGKTAPTVRFDWASDTDVPKVHDEPDNVETGPEMPAESAGPPEPEYKAPALNDGWPQADQPAESWDDTPPLGDEISAPADDIAEPRDTAISDAEAEWAAAYDAESLGRTAETAARVADIPPPPATPRPSFEPKSHSLRARIVRQEAPRKTFTDRLVAFIQWLIDLIKRS
ncbi:MAG: hypothetical protein R3E09_17600 [Novosphingobium sp.]|nr:hypothetical protein [Novosphingobium sp.]